jgi:hypothetical protein
LNKSCDYPKNREIDALAVVDNELYLCEAKNSDGLSTQDKAKLVAAIERVRPDVLLLVCMDTDAKRMTLRDPNYDIRSELACASKF